MSQIKHLVIYGLFVRSRVRTVRCWGAEGREQTLKDQMTLSDFELSRPFQWVRHKKARLEGINYFAPAIAIRPTASAATLASSVTARRALVIASKAIIIARPTPAAAKPQRS